MTLHAFELIVNTHVGVLPLARASGPPARGSGYQLCVESGKECFQSMKLHAFELIVNTHVGVLQLVLPLISPRLDRDGAPPDVVIVARAPSAKDGHRQGLEAKVVVGGDGEGGDGPQPVVPGEHLAAWPPAEERGGAVP